MAPDYFMPRQDTVAVADPVAQWLYSAALIITARLLPQISNFLKVQMKPCDQILQWLHCWAQTGQHVPHCLFLDVFQKEGENLALALRFT